MLDLFMRDVKEVALKPMVGLWARVLTPNQITTVSFLFGLASARECYYGHTGTAVVYWALNRILDGLDGAVARATNTQSDFGGFFDMVLDCVVYSVIPIAIAVGDGTTPVLIATNALIASFFVNNVALFYLSALLEKRQHGAAGKKEQTSVTMPPALVEGTETIAFFTVFISLPAYALQIFTVMAVLVSVGTVQRVLWAWRHIP